MQRLTACGVSVLLLALTQLPASAVSAEILKDPRIGEWREDHYAGGVGLYMIYEDLGNGVQDGSKARASGSYPTTARIRSARSCARTVTARSWSSSPACSRATRRTV